MTQTQPKKLVSILINNYNYASFLTQAIDSALNQTYSDCEVIVVDDGSTDHSREIMQQYGHKITPIFQENGGQASAFNSGFAKSQGDIICFLDADDVFLPHKAQQLVDIVATHPNVGWMFHALERVDLQLKPLPAAPSDHGTSGRYDLRQRLKKGKLNGSLPFNSLATSGLCFTRELLSKILPMPSEIKITSDDYIKYAALGSSPGYAFVEHFALQRIHGNNAYTFRNDKQLLRAKILIQTAYFLRQNFPDIKAYANNLFALGLAEFIQHHQGERQPIHQQISAYLSALTPWELATVQFRKTYYLYSSYLRRK